MDVDLEGATVVSWVALAFGAVSLWFGVLQPWWQRREAHPEARLEELRYPTEKRWQTDRRAVVVNHGAAVMRQVTVRLVNDEGGEYTEHGRWSPIPMPIPEIHVGQAIHLPVMMAYGDAPMRSAVLSWRDRRARTQRRTFWLTWQLVT